LVLDSVNRRYRLTVGQANQELAGQPIGREATVDIRIDRGSTVPIYLQICRGIREMILSGALPEGFRLPPERRLAESLGVNRSTVLSAYRELRADALVDSHVGRGTSVRTRAHAPAAGTVEPLPWRQLVRPGMTEVQDPLLRDLLELAERPDVIPLSVGLPAPELLPLDTLRAVLGGLFDEVGPAMLLHSPTEGLTAFRETLCQLMVARGIRCSPSELLVTSGSQQGLDLVARVFLAPGDAIVAERPTFFGALQILRRAQVRVLGVPTDGDGMRTDALEALLERHRPKLIYTLPTFQNPSGAVMALQRRERLLELARRYQVPVLEDDPYCDLRYEGEPLPSLKALDEHGYVLYLSSFSKVLFPGMRIGWLAAPRPAARQLALAKQAADLHSSTAGQFVLDRFVRAGHYTEHVGMLRGEYARRRDLMHEVLRETAPPEVAWTKPQGGFYFWLRLPDGIRQSHLLSLAAERRVSYLPGDACFAEEPGGTFVRLNFTLASPQQIREGVSRLMEAVRLAARTGGAARQTEGATPPIV
jgi:DNA-binding transcriptional MocR family regulator